MELRAAGKAGEGQQLTTKDMILDTRIIRFLKDLHGVVGFTDVASAQAITEFEQTFLQRIIGRALETLSAPDRERVIALSTKMPGPKPEEISNLLNSLITTSQRDEIAAEEASAHAKEYIIEILKNTDITERAAIRVLIEGLSTE